MFGNIFLPSSTSKPATPVADTLNVKQQQQQTFSSLRPLGLASSAFFKSQPDLPLQQPTQQFAYSTATAPRSGALMQSVNTANQLQNIFEQNRTVPTLLNYTTKPEPPAGLITQADTLPEIQVPRTLLPILTTPKLPRTTTSLKREIQKRHHQVPSTKRKKKHTIFDN